MALQLQCRLEYNGKIYHLLGRGRVFQFFIFTIRSSHNFLPRVCCWLSTYKSPQPNRTLYRDTMDKSWRGGSGGKFVYSEKKNCIKLNKRKSHDNVLENSEKLMIIFSLSTALFMIHRHAIGDLIYFSALVHTQQATNSRQTFSSLV